MPEKGTPFGRSLPVWAIIGGTPRVLSKYGNCTRLSTVVFTNKVGKNLDILRAFFNITIIPLASVGYGMIIANSAHLPSHIQRELVE